MIINDINKLNIIIENIIEKCTKNTVILLNGDLGAGKTTFTKNLLKTMGVKEVVNSPTFTILNIYQVDDLQINHIDAYRLTENDELDMYLEQMIDAFSVVEWPEYLKIDYNQFNVIEINIKIIDENSREFEINMGEK